MAIKTKDSLQSRDKYFLGFIFGLAIIVYGIFIYRTVFSVNGETYFTLVDDAMISMRYAKNLANGYGFVWNIGEPPIQGFTNMGWTFYMALLHFLPISASKISLLVMATSGVLLLGIAFLVFKISKIIDPLMNNAPYIAATVTAFYYPLVFWSLRGMEVGIITFLVYLSVLLAIDSSQTIGRQRFLLLGLVMLLALVVRFDAILQVTLVLMFVLFSNRPRLKSHQISPILFLYIGGIIAICLFQYLYFGSIFPNSYYLKVVGVSLQERLTVGIQVFIKYALKDFLLLLLTIIVGLFFYRDLRNKESFLLLALFFIQCAYSLYVGGDYAEPLKAPQVNAANRFIAQGMPSLIILFSIVIDRFLHKLRSRSGFLSRQINGISKLLIIGVSIGTLLVMSGIPWFAWINHNAPLLDADIWRTKLGVHIMKGTADDATIAAHAAGQISYYSNRRTLDLLGKSDPIVAHGPPSTSFRPGHNKWNYEYSIMTLKPDLIADEWGELKIFLSNQPEYYRLENGIWVRKDSTLLNIDELAKDYRK